MIVSDKPKIELLNCDCMEYMKTVPDKYFELAIVDPIYGHNITGGYNSENGWGNKEFWHKASHQWNTIKTKPEYFVELFRVSKNQIVCGGNYFSESLPSSEGWVVWDKGQRDFSLADAELIWTSFDKATRIFDYSRAKNNQNGGLERIHPTQKPIQMYKWLLKNYAKEGDKIFDSHGGSRSLAIACHQMGFDHVSCEIDLDYHNDSVKRFKEQTMQTEIKF